MRKLKYELVEVKPQDPDFAFIYEIFCDNFKISTQSQGMVSAKPRKFSVKKIIRPDLFSKFYEILQECLSAYPEKSHLDIMKFLFHGTSRVSPEKIYESDVGFYFRNSREDCYFGNGMYFARESTYSHNYAHKNASRKY